MITRKLFIVPNDEYIVIKNMGSGNKFETMMAYKMVYKRVLNGIFSLLGVTLDRDDTKDIDTMAENMRVDDETNTPYKSYNTWSKASDQEKKEYKVEFRDICESNGVNRDDIKDFFDFVSPGMDEKATFNEIVHFLRKQDLMVEQIEAYVKWKEKQA